MERVAKTALRTPTRMDLPTSPAPPGNRAGWPSYGAAAPSLQPEKHHAVQDAELLESGAVVFDVGADLGPPGL